MKRNPNITVIHPHALLVNWEAKISEQIHHRVLQLDSWVRDHLAEELLETVPTYHSLTLYLHEHINAHTFKEKLTDAFEQNRIQHKPAKSELVTIPVCYDLEFAPDIESLAQEHKLTVEEVIQRHTAPCYRIYFLGFLPGFPYLGGLDKQLATPRKTTPRQRISPGSVGIAGNQTGIYTVSSPGGWNIIGRSPVQLLKQDAEHPTVLTPGDYLKFEAIEADVFKDIEAEVKAGAYRFTKTTYHD